MFALAALSYLSLGALLVLVGANQHALATRLSLDLSQTGLLGALMALGITGGVLASGPVLDRFPRRPLVLGAALLAAAALGGAGETMSFARVAAHIFVAGLGLGALDNFSNVIFVERDRAGAGRMLSFLHAFATLGAFVTPLLIARFSPDAFLPSFHATAIACLAIAALGLTLEMPPPPHHAPAPAPEDSGDSPGLQLRHPVFIAMCVVGFAYVGVENGITVFAVPYATDSLGLAPARGQTGISALWCGLFLGRLAVGFALSRPSAGLLFVSGVSATAVLAAGLLFAWTGLEWLFGAVGVALAAVFPVMVAVGGSVIERGTGRALGLLTAIASSGGFVVPWLAGVLGDAAGTTATMLSMLAGTGIVALGSGWALLALRRAAPATR